jgi:nucleoid-associated protein YgaU
VAATAFLAPQALASTTATDTTAHHTAHHAAAAVPAAFKKGPAPAKLESATHKAAAHKATAPKAKAATPTSYTVQAGDSLSAISDRFYHNSAAWPVLYWANHKQVQWADIIQTGQVLSIPVEPSSIPGAPSQLDPPALAAPVATSYTPAPAQESAPVQATPVQAAPAQAAQTSTATSSGSSYSSSSSGAYPGGSFGQCVVARESGGNSQVMNSSGHYGLYQFSASTWAAYGGNPASFGNASVAEQNQVFSNAIAAGGQSNWSPYDGC